MQPGMTKTKEKFQLTIIPRVHVGCEMVQYNNTVIYLPTLTRKSTGARSKQIDMTTRRVADIQPA